MSSSRVIEIEDVTAGIVVQERPGLHRFYAVERRFRPLEARQFTHVEQAARAARALASPHGRSGPLRREPSSAALLADSIV